MFSAPSIQFCVIFLTLFLHFFTFHFCNYFFQDCSLQVWIITIVPVKMVKISCFWFNNLEQPANAMIVFFLVFLSYYYSHNLSAFVIPITILYSQYTFFISNQGQASALKVTYIFKVLGAQICLMFALQFDQATYVCEEYSNFQDSNSLFIMISDFKVFPIIILRWYLLK